MAETENISSFLKENKKLVKEYLDTRLELYRLMIARVISKSAGYLLWIIISLMLALILFVFAGLVLGFWLSHLTGSYTKGFGFTTLIILGIIFLVALFRKTLFINPAVRNIIRIGENAADDHEE